MRVLQITPQALFTNAKQANFLLLGSEEAEAPAFRPLVNAKINHEVSDHLPGIWGTLGMASGEKILWQGNLTFSRAGNDNSLGKTLDEIHSLYDIHNSINGADSVVMERFINFDEIEFPAFPERFSIDEMPRLRLTLFIKPEEGALVFFQHYKTTFDKEKDSDIEYILPEPVTGDPAMADRLTYIFPILPRQKIIATDTPGIFTLDTKDLGKSFVVKALTFKRSPAGQNAEKVMGEVINIVNNGQDGHKLLKYIYAQNKFYEVNNTDVIIDPSAKTLLLIHGTFSTTDKSYNGLLHTEYDNNTKSWLQKTMEQYGYLQILAFDHETVTYDAAGNISKLMAILGQTTFKDNAHMDVITTSRGGLVGKYLTCCFTGNTIPVRRMVNIACANGVGYFDTGRHIATFLSIYKTIALSTGNLLTGIITGLAQFSAEYFLNQPGCQQMTIGNPRLDNIITKTPTTVNAQLRIQPIVGDWDASLVDNENLFKRLAERGLDLIIRQILGQQNDWVVGTDKQRIAPPGYSNAPIQVRSMHVKYLNSDYCPDHVHQTIWAFLSAP